MRSNLMAALAAAVLSCASGASAAIVTLTMTGEYGDPIGPTGYFGEPADFEGGWNHLYRYDGYDLADYQIGGFSWSTTITFVAATGATTVDWDISSGLPSPIQTGTYTGLGGELDLSGAQHVTIYIDQFGPAYAITGADYSLTNHFQSRYQPITATLTDPFEDDILWAGGANELVDWEPGLVKGPFRGGSSYLFDAKLEAVPEPATWALLIMGIGTLGAVLRRRRLHELAGG
jgi:hypothetical protein